MPCRLSFGKVPQSERAFVPSIAVNVRFCAGAAPRAQHALRWHSPCLGVSKETETMLYTLIVVLLVLWAVGLATSYTAGGLLHLLLLVALVMFVVQLVTGRRAV
jgi:hypothetical protein